MRFLAILIFAALVWARPLSAGGPVTLTPELRAKLEALPHLYGRRLGEVGLRERPVLISFFASWCPPCHLEFEHLARLHAEFAPQGLAVVAINLFEDFGGVSDGGARLDRFLARHAPWFSVVKGTDATAKSFDGVTRIPTVLIFDTDGRELFRFVHERNARKTNPTLAELERALGTVFPVATPSSGRIPRNRR